VSSSRPRVCVVGPSTRFTSGISYYTLRLANAMASRAGVSVVYFRNLLPRRMFPGWRHIGGQVAELRLNDGIPAFDGLDYNNPLTWARAASFLRRQRPDVVVQQWWTSSVAHMQLVVARAARSAGARVVVEFHEVTDPLEEAVLPIRAYSRVAGRLLTRWADEFITHSESDKALVVEHYGVSPSRVHVIPHGLYDQYGPARDRASSKKSLGFKPDDFVILSFGLLRPYKGVDLLLEAFEALPEKTQKRSRLLIVGELWEGGEEMRRRIEASPARERIRLVARYVPDPEVPLYFSAADVLCLPYRRASQSGVAHIGMSFGLPIVVSRVGGLSESMAEYEGTSFVPAGDVEALNRALTSAFKAGARKFSPPSRGWEQVIPLYMELIRRMENK